MDNIPTAEEFWLSKRPELSHIQIAREFAKLHVAAALKAANQNSEVRKISTCTGGWRYDVRQESILKAYPLKNIK